VPKIKNFSKLNKRKLCSTQQWPVVLYVVLAFLTVCSTKQNAALFHLSPRLYCTTNEQLLKFFEESGTTAKVEELMKCGTDSSKH